MGKFSLNSCSRESLLLPSWSMSIVVQEEMDPSKVSLGLLVDRVKIYAT